MGRAINSFTSYVGHAEETIDSRRVNLPEKDLWVAVLCRAALDAFNRPPDLNMKISANHTHQNRYTYDRDQARHFFMDGGFHFNLICEMAGRNPQYIREKAKTLILRENGWNVDVPITSHYRQGPKKGRGRPRKKKLTGNSYYAARGKKEEDPRNTYDEKN